MEKKTKFYTVIWTDEAKEEYDIPKNDFGIVPLDNDEVVFNVNKTKIGRPKMRWATIYPIFESEEEAEAYRQGNKDWQTIKVSINNLR